MTGEFIQQGKDLSRDEGKFCAMSKTPACFYLGGVVHMVPDGCGCRIGGFGEPYCIMMRRLPCPENCPDWKAKG